MIEIVFLFKNIHLKYVNTVNNLILEELSNNSCLTVLKTKIKKFTNKMNHISLFIHLDIPVSLIFHMENQLQNDATGKKDKNESEFL